MTMLSSSASVFVPRETLTFEQRGAAGKLGLKLSAEEGRVRRLEGQLRRAEGELAVLRRELAGDDLRKLAP